MTTDPTSDEIRARVRKLTAEADALLDEHPEAGLDVAIKAAEMMNEIKQARLARSICASAASFIADLDANSSDVADYLEQRFGPVLRHPAVRAALAEVAADGRKLVR
jgi:hypothetical protein